jgi:hypothetical protein
LPTPNDTEYETGDDVEARRELIIKDRLASCRPSSEGDRKKWFDYVALWQGIELQLHHREILGVLRDQRAAVRDANRGDAGILEGDCPTRRGLPA